MLGGKDQEQEVMKAPQNISPCPTQTRVSKTSTQFRISLILMACCCDTLTILIAPLFKASLDFSYRHL